MIQLTNLTKSFGGQTLFQDINLKLSKNQKIGFVGRNGSGKSTLFKIILDEDGNLVNRDELIEALREGAAETELAVAELQKAGGSFVLYFAYDDTEIDEAATRVIIEHANFMQNNPSVRLRLEGHADERGTREYNLALGENRALSVKEVVGLYNLEDRIVVVSYGEEQPISIEHNEEAWEKNRRVEFVYY